MLFHEKLQSLIQELSAPHVALARVSGVDASLISRFCNGTRVPSRFSPQLDKLAMGAASLAVQRGRGAQVCALCGIGPSEDRNILFDAVYAWFHQADSGLKPQRARPHTPAPQRAFAAPPPDCSLGDRLDQLMRAAGVSNMQLAQYLNLPPFHLSRFRTGVRSLEAEPRLLNNICSCFSTLRYTPAQRAAACALLEIPLTEESEALHAALRAYLAPKTAGREYMLADTLLASLDSLCAVPAPGSACPDTGPAPQGQTQALELFSGEDALRGALHRFSDVVFCRPQAQQISLFLDLGAGAVGGGLLGELLALLQRAHEAGARIHAVYALGADASLALDILTRCLPFSCQGAYAPYFCRREAESKFSSLLVMADGVAAVTSQFVTAAASYALYAFTEYAPLLENLRTQFTLLKARSAPVHIYGKCSAQEYFVQLSAFERAPGDTDVLVHSLSPYTLPCAALGRILQRGRVDPKTAHAVLAHQELALKRARRNLSLYCITDYICLPSLEQLAAGQVRVHLPGLGVGDALSYTPGEFAAHLEATLQTLREYPQYNLYLLPHAPFESMAFIVRQNAGTLLKRTQHPQLAMFIEHQQLSDAFLGYLDALRRKSLRVYPERGQGAAVMLAFLEEARLLEG